MKSAQLPLEVVLADNASFDNFHPQPNRAALDAVRALAEGAAGATPLLLHGAAGSGKTHLLQAAVRLAARRGRAAYLPLALLAGATPALLEGLDDAALLAIDDLDGAGLSPDFAQALLRLIDARRSTGAAYLLAARVPADKLRGLPADLRTRCGACAQFPLKPLDEAALAAMLQTRAQRRGLELPAEVADYLLRRLPRRVPDLLEALETLDRAALSAQRRLTVPFVSQTLPGLSGARTAPGR